MESVCFTCNAKETRLSAITHPKEAQLQPHTRSGKSGFILYYIFRGGGSGYDHVVWQWALKSLFTCLPNAASVSCPSLKLLTLTHPPPPCLTLPPSSVSGLWPSCQQAFLAAGPHSPTSRPMGILRQAKGKEGWETYKCTFLVLVTYHYA